jgi:RimJ/RimL family protein N-acetyltransferase
MADHARDDVESHDDEDDREAEDDLVPVRLRDGTEAVVVPLVPANREALQQEYAQLSAETRFDRFLSAVPELTDTMLDHLVDDVDGVDHVALVLLVTTEDGTELPLGLARIIRYPDDPTAADVAVTVVDEWQGQGVATALLGVLMRRRPPGVERIITVVSDDNEASLAMLRRLGDVEVSEPASGAMGVVVDLPGATTSRPHMSAASLFRPGREWVAKRSRATSSAPDDA